MLIHISQIKIRTTLFLPGEISLKNSKIQNSKFKNEAILEGFQLPKRVSLNRAKQKFARFLHFGFQCVRFRYRSLFKICT
jgi:hypothetical protein